MKFSSDQVDAPCRAGRWCWRCSPPAGSGARSTRTRSRRTRSSPIRCCSTRRSSDMERGRYEVARLTLQTLMNTYDTSEYPGEGEARVRR